MERIVVGAVPNEVVWRHFSGNGYETMSWLPVREEIVRCRDCRHYADHEWIIAPKYGLGTDVEHVCHFWHGEPTKVAADGYCAWGERRDG